MTLTLEDAGLTELECGSFVFLWGRVLEFEGGFRAQYAYPRELFVYGNEPKGLSRLYGVPVKVLVAPKREPEDEGITLSIHPALWSWAQTALTVNNTANLWAFTTADMPCPSAERKRQARDNIERLRADRVKGKRRLP